MVDRITRKNQYIPQQFGTLQAGQLPNGQVPMQAEINPELLKENVQDTYVANRVANTTDDPKAMMGTAALMVPTWFALTQGMDKFAKHSRGPWENTLQYKIAKFGDKVADSSFAQSTPMKKLGSGLKSFGNYIKTHILDKSRITRAIMETPSIPENSMARANHIGMTAMQLFDYPQHGENFTKPLKNLKDLDCYGATKEEIENFIRNNKPIQEAEFETLIKHTRDTAKSSEFLAKWQAAGADKAKILRDMKAFEWGYKDFAHMQDLAKHTHKYIPEIFEACAKANPKMFARIWGSNGSEVGKLSTKVFGREVFASETLNKLFAELGNLDWSKPENAKWKEVLERTGYFEKLPKSAFAKYLNKYTHLIMEGATNRVAGGKLVALAQAWFMAEALYKAATAEGGIGEKGKVFAERVVELVALFACIPLALKMMHGLGGMQYAGMTKEQVAAYRERLDAHNFKSASGGYATKAEWKAADKALKEELKAGVKNPFVKLAKKIGRIITVGLEQRRPWDKKDITTLSETGEGVYRKGKGEKLKDLLRHPKFGFKQMAGYPMRIILGMAIIMPFLSKTAVKACHAIVGKPQHSLLDEEKEQEQREKAMQVEVPDVLKGQQGIQAAPQAPYVPEAQSNLINQRMNGIPYQEPVTQQTTTQTTETKENKQPDEPVRTYIPSPVGVKITGKEDLTAAELALQRADIAEQQALRALKMG